MTDEIVLYEPEDEDEEPITAELSAGYDVMLSELQDVSDDDVLPDIIATVEQTIHQSIQARREGDELHKAYAHLIRAMEETDEIDIDSVVENSIHAIKQQQE